MQGRQRPSRVHVVFVDILQALRECLSLHQAPSSTTVMFTVFVAFLQSQVT